MTGRFFGLTIFLGALLLFSVQPMIGKYILPWFGGGPAVWTTCMLFFQLVLLAGYAYAHANIRLLKPKAGAIVHLVLLGLAIAVLPIIPKTYWKPADAADPTLRILLLLAVTLGLPYFVLSATSPLLQAWFGRVQPGKSPYRLYSLSNIGSLQALVLYPFVLEPYVPRSWQAWIWSICMILYAAMCAACVIAAWKAKPVETSLEAVQAGDADADEDSESKPASPPAKTTLGVRLLWLALPACAVVLLLAVTNALAQEVGALPFLWIVPLSVYLLSFIICFDHQRWYDRRIFVPLMIAMVILLGFLMASRDVSLAKNVAMYLVTLFVCCMACHGEVYRLKPDPSHLTGFYLMIAAGGALGGVLVAIVAPLIFTGYFELQIGLVACVLLTMVSLLRDPALAASRPMIAGSLGIGVAIIAPMMWNTVKAAQQDVLAARRNFYGTLRVQSRNADNPAEALHALRHGRIEHGTQYLATDRQSWPTTYYGFDSGVGLALRAMTQKDRRIGVVGLGAGTLAVYGRPGDVMRFYEINPQVNELAQTYFTYLRNCKAKVEYVMGDARLSMEREPDQQYDLLVLDAFSGDAIPAHLLTKEAFDIYARHLKPSGVLAAHVTNTYYELRLIVNRLAQGLGMKAIWIAPRPDHEWSGSPSFWVLMCRDDRFFSLPLIAKAARPFPSGDAPLWTDEMTNLLDAMRAGAWWGNRK